MNRITLLDAESLIAVLYRPRPVLHLGQSMKSAECPRRFSPAKPFSPKPVFLRQRMLGTSQAVYDFVATGAVEVSFNLGEEFGSVRKLAVRYQNVPMSLADACLVRMSEIYDNSTVFTTDGDFKIYRKNTNQIIPTIMPEGI